MHAYSRSKGETLGAWAETAVRRLMKCLHSTLSHYYLFLLNCTFGSRHGLGA